MAKTYKILVNDGKGTDIQPVRVVQGAGANGGPARLLAKRGWRFELQDDLKGKSLAPDQVRIKRVGKNLTLMFDGSQRADVVIEDFYAENTDKDKDNGSPKLVGTAENGGMYEYVPQDPAVSSMPAELKDGNTPVIVALGGGPLEGDFVLAGLPLVAAAGGISGWAVAGGAAAAAAAGGGGGGGGAAVVVKPSGQTGFLKHDVTNDTGTSQTDSLTNNANPIYTGVAEKGAKVVVVVHGVSYETRASTTDGSYSVELKNEGKALPDGKYTPTVTVTNSAGNSTVDGSSFTVDGSAENNQPDNQVDPNRSAVIAVTAVSEDTGGNGTDFITTDTTVTASGTVTGFSSTGVAVGERFRVQIVDKDGVVKAEEFVTPTSDNKWAMTTPTSALALGDYTIKAEIVDVAGNVVKSGEHALKVVDSVLTAMPDTATVREDLTLKAEGNLIRGTSSGNGTDVDTNERFETLKIDKIKAGNGSFQDVGSETTITGTFGDLTLKADGTYTYTLKNTDTKVQALTNTGTTGLDEFTYEVTNSKGQRSSTTLKVMVNGTDDTAVITPPINNQNSIGSSTTGNLKDTIEIKDADKDDNKLDVLDGGSKFTGSFSTFEITQSVEPGKYKWVFDKSLAVDPSESVNRHDLYTMNSKDGSASLTLDFVIKATSTVTVQEFHTSTLKGLKVEASTENITDTLVLRGQQLEFDFTGDVATKDIKSIEKVDITGTGSNTIKLSLDSLVQADTVSLVVNGSTLTVHRLFIEGDTNDAVQLNSSLGTSSNHVAPIAGTGALSGYNVYHFDATHELLIQQSITSITFAG